MNIDKNQQCNWIRGYVDYTIPAQQGKDQGPLGGTWPDTTTQTLSLTISSQASTSHNVYLTGGTVINQGTFTATSSGYSEQGFPIDIPIVTFNVRKKYDSLPSGWATVIAAKVGKINNAILFGAPIGTLKYKGLSTSDFPIDGTDKEIELTHIYEYKAQNSSFTVNSMTIAGKKGWEVYDFKTKNGDKNRVTVGWQILGPFTQANIAP